MALKGIVIRVITTQPSIRRQLLWPVCNRGLTLTLAGNNPDSASSSSLNEALIGSENAADWPLLDDIHAVKLMRLIRVLRCLRELQRDVFTTEETS